MQVYVLFTISVGRTREIFMKLINEQGIVFLLTAFLLSGCGLFESDTDSIIWQEEDLNDFIVYAYAPDGDSFAVIDLITGEIYRLIDAFKGIQSVVATQEGSLIYVSTFRVSESGDEFIGEIYKVNTATWEHEIVYDQAAHLLENRNDGIFFITKGTTRPLSKRMFGEINASTGAVTEIDSIDVDWGAWFDDRLIEIHPYRPLIYAVNESDALYKYNYNSQIITPLFDELSFQPFGRITLSGGGDSLYIPGGPVLDVNREEMVGAIPVWRLGSAAARRDNKEVYITDPGGYLREPYSQGKIFVYDPEKNEIKAPINVESVTDLIYLTPQERYAVVNNWMSRFLVVDLKTRKVVADHEYIENNVQTQSIQGLYLAPKPPSLK